jgi:glutamyl-tRNA reductase
MNIIELATHAHSFSHARTHASQVVARNTALRRREMLEAEAILHEEQLKFRGWQQSLTAIPAISKMQEKFESMRAEEVRKAANKLSNLNKKEMEVVEKLSKGIVNKMLHGPMSALRSPEGPEEKKRTLKILKAMFKLEKEFLMED